MFEQQHGALRVANTQRKQRCELLAQVRKAPSLRASRERAAEILEECCPAVRTLEVMRLLLRVRRVGHASALRFLNADDREPVLGWRIAETRMLGEMSERQRRVLAERLRTW